jgi:hypothetical protein
MKTKLITALSVLAIVFGTVTPASATDNSVEVISDAAVARPACFVATVIGTAIFVAILPIALTSRSVKQTAHTLVVTPAKATFTRPLGDFSSLKD